MDNITPGRNFNPASGDFDVATMNKLLDDAYLQQRRADSDKAKKSFAPSGLGWGSGNCPRFWYYSFKGGITRVDDNDAKSIANMAYGTQAHDRIKDLFKRAEVLIDDEIKVNSSDPPIFGFVDLLIRWQNESVPGEIKTAKQESFNIRKANKRPPGYHLIQLLIYMRLMNKQKGFFLYENKNTQELLVIPVTWTDANTKLVDDVFDWMRQTYKAFEEDKAPKRPFTIKSKTCKECPFYKNCWEDPEGKVEIPPLELPK